MTETQSPSIEHLLEVARQSLEDDKGEAIVTIPLEGKSSIGDYMLIASGRSSRQVASMAEKLAIKLKQAGAVAVATEGLPKADWVLVDARDIIVHLFRPEVRSFYNLEKMWGIELPPELREAIEASGAFPDENGDYHPEVNEDHYETADDDLDDEDRAMLAQIEAQERAKKR
jgi:ribosome-associated protein